MEEVNYLIPLFAVIALIFMFASHHYNTERLAYLLKIGGFVFLICTSFSCYAAVSISCAEKFDYDSNFEHFVFWVCVVISPVLCSLAILSNWVDYANSGGSTSTNQNRLY
jgi:hypothetical protein